MANIYDKANSFAPYVPSEPKPGVRLNANESYRTVELDIAPLLKHVELNRYPDPLALPLLKTASGYYGVKPEQIIAGNGSDELIMLLITAFLPQKAKLLLVAPDFEMYSFYARAAELDVFTLRKNDDLQIDLDALLQQSKNADMLILSNPCNPTGQGICFADMERFLDKVNCLTVIDEAYMEFWDQSIIQHLHRWTNVIVLRTLSKVGFAAIRLGFAISPPEITAALNRMKTPYTVNTITQAVGVSVLKQPEYITALASEIVMQKTDTEIKIDELLKEANDKVCLKRLKTHANFILLRGADAKSLYDYAAKEQVILRYFAPDILRITAGSADENKTYLKTMDSWIRKT
jgi:histidinol-phosphate aminotransferase